MRASAASRRARAASFSSGREPVSRRFSRSRAASSPAPRHVAPRAGVVARLRRAGAGGEEALHPVEVLLGPVEVGLRAHDLRLRLAHVLDARAGQAEAQLGLGEGALGAGRVEGEARVGRVDPGQLLAGDDRAPLVHGQALDGAGGLGRDADFGGLDVAGGHDEARVLALAAGAARGGDDEEGGDEGNGSPAARHGCAPLRRCRDGRPSGASPGYGPTGSPGRAPGASGPRGSR